MNVITIIAVYMPRDGSYCVQAVEGSLNENQRDGWREHFGIKKNVDDPGNEKEMTFVEIEPGKNLEIPEVWKDIWTGQNEKINN